MSRRGIVAGNYVRITSYLVGGTLGYGIVECDTGFWFQVRLLSPARPLEPSLKIHHRDLTVLSLLEVIAEVSNESR